MDFVLREPVAGPPWELVLVREALADGSVEYVHWLYNPETGERINGHYHRDLPEALASFAERLRAHREARP